MAAIQAAVHVSFFMARCQCSSVSRPSPRRAIEEESLGVCSDSRHRPLFVLTRAAPTRPGMGLEFVTESPREQRRTPPRAV